MLFFIIGYFIIGILIFARYDKMNPYQKVTYGFFFPIQWLLGIWISATLKNRSDSLLDNDAFLIGAFIICMLLLACGS